MKRETVSTTPRATAAALGGVDRHLAAVARGGALNLFGAIAAAFFNFALVVVITRGLHVGGAGPFFVAVALFSILSNTCELGADTGLMRMIPRALATGRERDARQLLAVAGAPVLAVGALVGAGVVIAAEPIAHAFARGVDPSTVVPYLRVLGLFLPISAAYTVLISGTRGFGTMVPAVVIDKLAKPALQPALAAVAIAAGAGGAGIAIAYAGPIGLGFIAAIAWLAFLSMPGSRERAASPIAKEFWRFSAPRGLAGFFQVAILWLDTLLVSVLRSTKEAGIYAASTRYILIGSFVNVAVLQVVGPKISELLSSGDREGARSVFRIATAWLILVAWPIYLGVAIFAPVLLGVFGRGYAAAQTPLLILAIAGIVASGVGPVDVVLLMAGKSSWNLRNTAIALVVNVVLNLALIPHFGMTGAAVAWAASILVNNLLPFAQVRRLLGIEPFGPAYARAAAAAIAAAAAGLLARLILGATWNAVALTALVGGALFLLLVRRSSDELELSAFLAPRRKGPRS